MHKPRTNNFTNDASQISFHGHEVSKDSDERGIVVRGKPTVTICIPAYNEQHNMDHILKQIFAQEQREFTIEKVIVASDGSTDNTVHIARKYKDLGVEVIDGKENRGQTYRQNEMMSKAESDILILLNADLLLGDRTIIAQLVSPIVRGADLSAQWARPLKPRTFLESILCAGFDLKYYIYTHYKKGNNIYTCVGHLRSLSKRFYTSFTFPEVSVGEDQYLYLACVQGGYRYQYAHGDHLYFKLPDHLRDYLKYAKRIFQTQKKYSSTFGEDIVNKERKLPLSLKMQGAFYSAIRNPFYTMLYLFLHFFVQRWALRQPIHSGHVFEVSQSTKIVVNNPLT